MAGLEVLTVELGQDLGPFKNVEHRPGMGRPETSKLLR